MSWEDFERYRSGRQSKRRRLFPGTTANPPPSKQKPEKTDEISSFDSDSDLECGLKPTPDKRKRRSVAKRATRGDSFNRHGQSNKVKSLEKMLKKPSFSELWNSLSVKLNVSDSINNLQQKDKIMEILEKACERAKVVTAMNYDTLLTATLRRYTKDQKPSVSSMLYETSNSSQSATKRACYAHNVEKFRKNMEDFHNALVDPCQHFIQNPRKYMLTESCFSSTAKLEFRSKRQRLPFAICCIRKTGFLSFFVGDWAYDDEDLPNSSNLNHYTTLKLDKFIDEKDLQSEEWKSMAACLEGAACPSDLDIGSVTMFMHEHRGNMVCAKVMINKLTTRLALRIYPHASFQTSVKPVFLNFDDDGEQYLLRIKNNELVQYDTISGTFNSTSYGSDVLKDEIEIPNSFIPLS